MKRFEKGDKAWTLAFDTGTLVEVPIESRLYGGTQYIIKYENREFVIPIEYLHETKQQAIDYFNGGEE